MTDFTEYELRLQSRRYEYLDHGTDVKLHSWGDTLKEAFEQCGISMFGIMTELEYVETLQKAELEATGDNLENLLHQFLDELLLLFTSEPNLICSKLVITEFVTEGENLKLKCTCYGEVFTLGKHPQGREVIGLHPSVQIVNNSEKYEVFVVISV